MPSITTNNLFYNSAEIFKESISRQNPFFISYIFIGNHVPYANESSPNSLVETVSLEKDVWDNIYAAKKITGNDVEFVVPRINWTSNVSYRQYDDTIEFSKLFASNISQNLYPMYVITSERNVYKCISNNASANSTVEPTGNYTTSNGNIATSDGYIWKYLYNIKPSNKFLNDGWMPTPNSSSKLDYNIDSTGIVNGELTSIIVTNQGTNYRDYSNIKVNSFSSGQTELKLSNTALVLSLFNISSLSNLANMKVTGTGISTGSYITSVSNTTGTITLSTETNGFGGNANNISIATRVYIDGDGTGAEANAILSTAYTNVTKITVSTIGTDYSTANSYIFGSGSGATSRVVLPPKFGHGFNSAKELNANNIMISVTIGQIDSTEGGLISTDTSFRQFGLLKNPYKYGSNVAVSGNVANSTISQTTNLDLVAGLSYLLNEFVYQGPQENPLAYGFINAQTSNQIRLSKVKGNFITGLTITGASSGISRTVIAIENPEFEPYTGEILYVENALKSDRVDGQAENIKLIISF